MKVNGSPDAPTALTGGGKSTAKAAAKPAESSPAPTSVSLSDLSARLHALESGGNADADFDAAKVEKIKQAIRDGKFEVDSSKVADKLISSVHELFGNKH